MEEIVNLRTEGTPRSFKKELKTIEINVSQISKTPSNKFGLPNTFG